MAEVAMTLAVADGSRASTMQYHYATALQLRGHRVYLFYGDEATPAGRNARSLVDLQRGQGIIVRRLPALSGWDLLTARRQLIQLCEGVSAIVSFNERDRIPAIEAARALGVPGVVSAQNQHRFSGRALLPVLKRTVHGNRIRRSADLVICSSEVVRREVVDDLGVPPDRCPLLPNGIPVSAGGTRPSSRPAGRPLRFVTVGRLMPQKGIDILIDAWKRSGLGAAGHELRIIGGISGGGQRAESRRYAYRLRHRIDVLGVAESVHLAGQSGDIPGDLAAADVYVHAARWEGPALPLAVLEALDASLPVVVTDCSGRPDGFVDGVNGWVVPAGDVSCLATAMCRLAAVDPWERRSMGQANRGLLESRYDIGLIGDRFVDLVERALVS